MRGANELDIGSIDAYTKDAAVHLKLFQVVILGIV
jgi:hypothetical protein